MEQGETFLVNRSYFLYTATFKVLIYHSFISSLEVCKKEELFGALKFMVTNALMPQNIVYQMSFNIFL